MAQKNATLQSLKKDLFATSEEIVMKALKKLKTSGDRSVIEPMIQVYSKSTGKIQTELKQMLSELKVSEADDILLNAALEDKYQSIRADLLSFVWNGGFQCNHRLKDIAWIGLNGDYMTTLESLTLLDTLDGPFEEADLMEAQIMIKEFLIANKEDERVDLVTSIHETLRGFDSRILD